MAKSQSKEATPKTAPDQPDLDKAKTKTKEKTDTKASEKTDAKAQKSKKPLILGLIAAVAALVGIVIAVVCLSHNLDPSDPKASLSYTKSFFIYDSGKYTLWNADGKQLTEDEYDSRSDFIDGYAYVYKDKQAGIINENGNLTVDFGKYGSITAKGGLYLAQDGNTKAYQLITGNGTVLEEGEDLIINGYNSTSPFAYTESNNKINLYTCRGKLITSIDITDDKKSPKLAGSNDFGLFHYGNQNTVFDARSGEILATFEDDKEYSFDSVSEDRSIILLENDEDEKYKLIAHGKLYDLDETKYYSITTLNSVIGYNNYSDLALLNNDYNVERQVTSNLNLKDTNNFAYETEDETVEIWQNGEKIQTLEDASIAASGVLFENYYAIEKDDKANFYNLDGSVAFDHDFAEIRSLFDKNHHAVVSDEYGKYFLIDTNGQQVGDYTAKMISSRDGGYEFRNDDGDYAVADENLTWITEYKYDSLYHRTTVVDRNIWTGRKENDSTYDVIDVDNHRNIIENINLQSVYANYFTAKNDDGALEYYTLNGEKFYTTKKS